MDNQQSRLETERSFGLWYILIRVLFFVILNFRNSQSKKRLRWNHFFFFFFSNELKCIKWNIKVIIIDIRYANSIKQIYIYVSIEKSPCLNMHCKYVINIIYLKMMPSKLNSKNIQWTKPKFSNPFRNELHQHQINIGYDIITNTRFPLIVNMYTVHFCMTWQKSIWNGIPSEKPNQMANGLSSKLISKINESLWLLHHTCCTNISHLFIPFCFVSIYKMVC